MTVRSFIFCDICNIKGVRLLDDRRTIDRDADIGRRTTDGRNWYEGQAEEAVKHGWVEDSRGRHICSRCSQFLAMDGRGSVAVAS